MRRSLALVIILAAASLTAPAQTGVNQVDQSTAGQAVVAAYQQFNEALVKKDGAALERILADNFSETDTFVGVIKTREIFLGAYRDGSAVRGGLEAVEVKDPKVSVHGGTAVLTARAEVKGRVRNGQSYSVPVLITTVFEMQQGRWRMLALHGSRIDTLRANTANPSPK